MQLSEKLTVFFDGSCPLCRREIDFYKTLDVADSIYWADISQELQSEVVPGLSKCDAMRRFHVMTQDGTLVSGAEGFVALWSALPRFQFLGSLGRFRSLMWLAEYGYIVFLKMRPSLQQVVGFLKKRGL